MTTWLASYRLQLSKDFTFADAAKHLPYFRRLGVSHLYLSPIFESRPGSNHGYDVIDPNRISGERGGEKAFYRLCRAAAEHGLGVILDIVPNHLAACYANPYWRDVLKHGSASVYAEIFDIDWRADAEEKLVLPVLAKPLSEVLAAGELSLTQMEGETVLTYDDQYFPLSPRSFPPTGSPSTSRLEEILELQNYRLMDWQGAMKHLNYRRFFDIDGLAAVHADRPKIFPLLHRKLREVLLKTPAVQGLRVDHIDGLADPKAYLDQLQKICGQTGRPIKIWVEKILAEDEKLPADWPCEGTTGYDFSRALDTMTVKAYGLKQLHRIFQKLDSAADTVGFAAACRKSKKQVLRELFPAELQRLSRRLQEFLQLRAGDAEKIVLSLTAALPVYRTYYTPQRGWSEQDRRFLDAALEQTKKEFSELAGELENLREELLSPHQDWPSWIVSWQQLSVPVMAKGYEDTLLYRYFPLVSLCEVGGQRTDRAVDRIETFLNLVESRQALSMNATSTHDSKRGEDLRWRLHALSETPDLYEKAFSSWLESEKNSGLDTKVLWFAWQNWLGLMGDSTATPSERRERLQNYVIKALRESKLFSHWLQPDEEIENKSREMVHRLCLEETADRYEELLSKLDRRGCEISLQCTVLKFLLPGFPDIYQGSESWNFNLADPDNRRPVDFAGLAEQLQRYGERPFSEVPLAARKLVLTHRLLKSRRVWTEIPQRDAGNLFKSFKS